MDELLAFVSSAGSADANPTPLREASDCLDRLTLAFNRCDAVGVDAQLHFPHVMFSGAELLIWPAAGRHPSDFFDRLRATGWASTRYEAKEVVLAGADKIHFLVTYTRRDATDRVLTTHRNVWMATRVDGRWGIALRSY